MEIIFLLNYDKIKEKESFIRTGLSPTKKISLESTKSEFIKNKNYNVFFAKWIIDKEKHNIGLIHLEIHPELTIDKDNNIIIDLKKFLINPTYENQSLLLEDFFLDELKEYTVDELLNIYFNEKIKTICSINDFIKEYGYIGKYFKKNEINSELKKKSKTDFSFFLTSIDLYVIVLVMSSLIMILFKLIHNIF